MKVLVIFGPTATGKTDLALRLAKKFNGQIISADSRQVYKKLDIGTGKLSKKLSNGHKIKKLKECWVIDGIKIYGFDLVAPEEGFSAADFISFAKKKMKIISDSNMLPIITGGSGFYVKSLIDPPQTFEIIANEKLRQKLQKNSKIELFNKLLKLNPKKANSLNNSDKNNPRRLIRAIEIALSKNIKTVQPKSTSQYQILGLSAKNKFLYAKVDDWIDFRMNNGLIKEVNGLLKETNVKWLISLGLEYRWITRFINKLVTREVATERLKGDIHKLIRNQKNWFRQFSNIKLFNVDDPNWQRKLEKTVSLWYTQSK